MNNYSPHPIQNADSFINNNDTISSQKTENCFPTQKYNEDCTKDVMFGYRKPLNEECAKVTGHLNSGPENGCTSLWNNMTRRKTLIKDY
tara:strand:- start:85 stop:351 length:267 start_codon:yes stop_codon:yes gene_type:complete